jgi:hypothetical protein
VHPGVIAEHSNCIAANVYEYRYPAPYVPRVGISRRTVLKEWGSLVSSDEVYCLEDLEEFVHVPASHFQASAPHTPGLAKRKREDEQDSNAKDSSTNDEKIQPSASKTAQEHPPKRRKVCEVAIFDLIPPVRLADDFYRERPA